MRARLTTGVVREYCNLWTEETLAPVALSAYLPREITRFSGLRLASGAKIFSRPRAPNYF